MHTEISPWVEKLSPYRLVIAIGAAGLVLVVALAWVGWRWSVAEGRMERGMFVADTILAKHDERYMPPELGNLSAEHKVGKTLEK